MQVILHANGSSSKLWVNGIEVAGNAGTQSMDGLTLGAIHSQGSNFLHGKIAEVIMIDPADADAEAALLQSYFTQRHGV